MGDIIAVIPARGGSKGIPRKNLVPLGDRPLLAWSIDAARGVAAIDRIIVSTDDAEIAAVAARHGAEVADRPAALATDDAPVIDMLRDLIRRLAGEGRAPEIVLLLEPTCPFRCPGDIADCLARLEDETVDSVATFKAAALNPCRAWKIEGGRPSTFIDHANPWLPRQRLPAAYQLNGAVYAFRASRLQPHHAILFGRTAAVVMPDERSIDVDTWEDLARARALATRRLAG